MRSGETPLLARYVRTASARDCDRRVFVADDPVLSVWPPISILISGLAISDAATMSRIVYESGFSAERPVSNVTPRSTTGVFASVNRIGHPAASTRGPAAVPGHLSLVSSMPSPSVRSEEHTSELQSRRDLVCRLLLEKKKNLQNTMQQTALHTPRTRI